MKFIYAREIKPGDRLAHTHDNGETVLRKVTRIQGVEMDTKMVNFTVGEPEWIDANAMVAVQ